MNRLARRFGVRIRTATLVTCTASALLALVPAPLHVTGGRASDALVVGAFGAVVPVVASRARRWTWFAALGLAAVVVVSAPALAAIVVGLVAATAGTLRWIEQRTAGLLVGAALAQALVHADPQGNAVPLAACGAVALAIVAVSAYRAEPRKRRRTSRAVAAGVAAAAVALAVLLAVSLSSARSPLDRGVDDLNAGLAAARRGDQAAASASFGRAADSLRAAREELDAWWAEPARLLPVGGRNAGAASEALVEAEHLADDARAAADAVAPGRITIAQGHIDVGAIAAAAPTFSRAATDARDALATLDSLRSPWLLAPLRSRLDDMRNRISDNLGDLELARDAAAAAPDLLGDPTPRRYLVVFVTPVEARATGFPGNYAELVVDHGALSLGRFGRITDLSDPGHRTFTAPADYEGRYGYLKQGEWRDLTVSPDFPTVADLMRQLYPQSTGTTIDGVLRVDPSALAALLRYTGPVTIPGAPFPLSADNAEQFLLKGQYTTYASSNQERIDALDSLGHATFELLLHANLPGPAELANTFAPLVSEGHLAFVRFDPASESVLDRAGVSGIPPPSVGDTLGVFVNNAGGNKADAFLTRDVAYDVTVDDSGAVDAIATVTLRNDAPPSGLPRNVIGNAVPFFNPGTPSPPDGTNRTWLTVYSPFALTGAEVNGQATRFNTAGELGRLAHSAFIDLPPQSTTTVTLHLSGAVEGTYSLLLWRQALAIAGHATVTVHRPGKAPVTTTVALDQDHTIPTG